MGDHGPAAPALAGIHVENDTEISRGDALLKGVLAAGALYGLGAIGPYVRGAVAGASDVDILNFVLWFEYMQATLYSRGASELNDKGEKMKLKSKEKELVKLLLTQEDQHIAAVKKMIEKLGGKPRKMDKSEFAFAYRIFESFLVLAGELETAAIGTYNGSIPSLESKEARELAFSIVQVEGRHAAAVLIPNHEEPAPEAFDIGLTKSSSIAVTEQFTGYYER